MEKTNCPGFLAAGIAAGIKKNGGKDLGLIFSQVPASAAGVFTRNRVQAAPVILDRRRIGSGICQAVIVNSGNANCCTGEQGMQHATSMAAVAAENLNIPADRVLVASTGVIGLPMPMDKITRAVPGLVQSLSADGFSALARAIMTTDTVPKQVTRTESINGKTFTLTAAAKGAGMIRPDMATMLCFVCTDVSAQPATLRAALARATDGSFNRMTIDGDTSTNDTVLLLANGRSGVCIDAAPENGFFQEVLDDTLMDLARQLVRDGEGVTKLVEIRVQGAASADDARRGGRYGGPFQPGENRLFRAGRQLGPYSRSCGTCRRACRPRPDRRVFRYRPDGRRWHRMRRCRRSRSDPCPRKTRICRDHRPEGGQRGGIDAHLRFFIGLCADQRGLPVLMCRCPAVGSSTMAPGDASPDKDEKGEHVPMTSMRLQKFLSGAGVCSRRKGEQVIQQGRVRVNGTVVTELGSRVDPDTDRVAVDGRPVSLSDALVYIALNKPKGYVTSCSQPGDTTVMELVDVPVRVYPVGRLDRDSTGLLILTNDGRLHHRLSHPSFDHEKAYRVTVSRPMPQEALKKMAGGLSIMGTRTRPAEITRISPRQFQIVLKEGKNRQIRRMVGKVGHQVTELVRIRMANIRLGDLPPGSWRYLTDRERDRLLGRVMIQ